MKQVYAQMALDSLIAVLICTSVSGLRSRFSIRLRLNHFSLVPFFLFLPYSCASRLFALLFLPGSISGPQAASRRRLSSCAPFEKYTAKNSSGSKEQRTTLSGSFTL